MLVFLVTLIINPNDALNLFSNYSPFKAFETLFEEHLLLRTYAILQIPIIIFLVIIIIGKNYMPSATPLTGIGGPPAAGNGQYGSARFQNRKETNKTSKTWPLGSIVIAGGIVFGAILKRRKSSAWIDVNDTNTCIIGTTRSGKTRRLVYPTIWMLAHAGESMLLTDPKGELYDRSSTYLMEMGYKVKVIDFRKPGWGNYWNPMQPVLDALKDGDIATATQHAWSIANMFVYQKPGDKGGESIWKDGAESVIAALIMVVAMEAPNDTQKHMYSVYRTLGELGKARKVRIGNQIVDYVALNDYMENLRFDHPARDAYNTATLAPERTRGSFFSNVASLLRLFSDPSIRYLTSKQDHKLDELGKEKSAVFLIIPDEDKTRHPLAALYVDQSYKALVECANVNGGRLPVRVNKLLDEFGNMPPLKDFDTKLTVSLGRGVRWNIILQDFSQLDSAYGKEVANTIRGNCQNLIYLLTTDPATAKAISERCGKYTVSTQSSSYNVGKGSSVSRGGSFGLTSRDLLTADEILRWPEGFSLVIRARQYPAYLPLPDLSQWPADKDLTPDGGEIKRKIKEVDVFIPDVNADSNHQNEVEEINEGERSVPSFMEAID
ncbi:VirD4-like conjugal transfer protein, CD1115 family [Paenibacillus agilis]|nr:type IV secretory system conjugative DNA transfer family protein [Paenibacillus agilis]